MHLADVGQLLGDDAADRRDDRGVVNRLLRGGDLRRRPRRRARAPRRSPRGARRRAAARGSPRRARTRSFAPCTPRASRRPSASPHRRAACASRSWRRAGSRSARRRLARRQARRPRRRRRTGALAVCASACRMSSGRAPACSSRSCASACCWSARARASIELGVGRVERREQVALAHAVALGDPELDEAPADLRRHLHVGRLDLARHADAVGGRLLIARARDEDGRGQEYLRRGRGLDGQPHGVGLDADADGAPAASMRRCASCMCCTNASGVRRRSTRWRSVTSARIGALAR